MEKYLFKGMTSSCYVARNLRAILLTGHGSVSEFASRRANVIRILCVITVTNYSQWQMF